MAHDTICTGAKLAAVADAIRARTGDDEPMTLDGMAEAVSGIPSGGVAEAVAGLVSRGITSVPEAGAITEVGPYAFAGCAGLAGEVVLPNAVRIGERAFDKCDAVTAIVAPECTELHQTGGSKIGSLKRVHYPKVERFQGFLDTGEMPDVQLPECTVLYGCISGSWNPKARRVRLPKLTSTEGPPGSYTRYALVGFSSTITSLSLDAIVEAHGRDSTCSLVQSCRVLESVYLPSVKTLGSYVFGTCQALRSLWLPSCTSMSHLAFSDWFTPVTSIVLPSQTVCELDGAFDSRIPISSGTGYVYVPSSLLDSYRSAPNWSAYAAQFRAIEDWPEEVEAARLNALSAAQGWGD